MVRSSGSPHYTPQNPENLQELIICTIFFVFIATMNSSSYIATAINVARNDVQFLVPPYYGFPEIATEVYVPSLPPHPLYPNSINLAPPHFGSPNPGFPEVPTYPYVLSYYCGDQFLLPPPDPELYVKIVKQIDYYFSKENLVKDLYLRKQMDEQGWVPIHVIAGFKRVKDLTSNIYLILDALAASSVVEVKDERIRKQYDWERWILPPNFQLPTNNVAEEVQSISLENNSNNQQDHVQPFLQYYNKTIKVKQIGFLEEGTSHIYYSFSDD